MSGVLYSSKLITEVIWLVHDRELLDRDCGLYAMESIKRKTYSDIIRGLNR